MLDAKQVRVRILVHEGSVDLCRLLIKTAVATGNDPHSWEFLSTDGATVAGLRGQSFDFGGEHPRPVNLAVRKAFEEMHYQRQPLLLLDADCTVLRPRLIEELVYQLNIGGGCALLNAQFASKLRRQGDGKFEEHDRWGWTATTGLGLYLPDVWDRLAEHFSGMDYSRPWDEWMGSLLFPDMLVPVQGVRQFPIADARSLDIVGRDAYLHHGCKDGSLQRLVIESKQ